VRALAFLLVLAGCSREPGGAQGVAGGGAGEGALAAEPIVVPGDPADSGAAGASVRRVVYVPAYSHIFLQDSRSPIDLAVTLSVRNTDPQYPIVVTAVRYYDDQGTLVRRFLDRPVRLGPLASASYVVEDRDRTAGVGANFIVEWTADRPVTEPLVEAVMISGASALGISFTSRGWPLRRLPADSPAPPPASPAP
jgi:hypothetical protein